jgi:TolA-binding protein
MDINKVQQLNHMAMELKRHNIVLTKDDAISQAENIYGHENDYSREAVHMQDTNEFEEMRKDVRKLTMGMQHLLQDMQEMKQKQEQLEKDLNDARVGMSRGRVHGGDPQQTLTNEPPKRDGTKPIDRNNIAPADVSVEKFFYFGK